MFWWDWFLEGILCQGLDDVHNFLDGNYNNSFCIIVENEEKSCKDNTCEDSCGELKDGLLLFGTTDGHTSVSYEKLAASSLFGDAMFRRKSDKLHFF